LSSETTAFINKRFDILIDINFDKLVPLPYISSLSNAGLKVGLFDTDSNKPSFDLMIDIPQPVETETYLKQIMHYLEIINSEKN
jgi:hypothetical protein